MNMSYLLPQVSSPTHTGGRKIAVARLARGRAFATFKQPFLTTHKKDQNYSVVGGEEGWIVYFLVPVQSPFSMGGVVFRMNAWLSPTEVCWGSHNTQSSHQSSPFSPILNYLMGHRK